MSVFKRGETYWYKFRFNGQVIRESAKTSAKQVAIDAERVRRREIELAYNSIPKKRVMPLFKVAAEDWLALKKSKAEKTVACYEQRMRPVVAEFGKRLICDVHADDILEYQSLRIRAGVSKRTIDYEVGCIRGVLTQHHRWSAIRDEFAAREVKLKLDSYHVVGKAITPEDEAKLLKACGESQAPSLLPLFIFARDTGLRAAEIKALRRRDLRLDWKDGLIVSGEVIVPRSKTQAGTGRCVPFTPDVCSTLTIWLSRFPKATLNSYLFPRHEVQQLKGGKETRIVDVQLDKPVQSWQRAWRTALKAAGSLKYRWHDTRHSFITRLAENPNVSEQTIRALAGHVSKQMLERYSHIRTQAKQEAIAALYGTRVPIQTGWAQKWAQSANGREKEN